MTLQHSDYIVFVGIELTDAQPRQAELESFLIHPFPHGATVQAKFHGDLPGLQSLFPKPFDPAELVIIDHAPPPIICL